MYVCTHHRTLSFLQAKMKKIRNADARLQVSRDKTSLRSTQQDTAGPAGRGQNLQLKTRADGRNETEKTPTDDCLLHRITNPLSLRRRKTSSRH
jgi:hypothetical protein